MKPEFFLAVVIVLLLGYIIYLNIKLAKKTLFIESTVRRLSGIEKNWSTDEMMKFLQEIRKISHYSSFFTDKLFDEQPLGFLLEDEMNSKIFIHYTREEEGHEYNQGRLPVCRLILQDSVAGNPRQARSADEA